MLELRRPHFRPDASITHQSIDFEPGIPAQLQVLIVGSHQLHKYFTDLHLIELLESKDILNVCVSERFLKQGTWC